MYFISELLNDKWAADTLLQIAFFLRPQPITPASNDRSKSVWSSDFAVYDQQPNLG